MKEMNYPNNNAKNSLDINVSYHFQDTYQQVLLILIGLSALDTSHHTHVHVVRIPVTQSEDSKIPSYGTPIV